MLMIIDEQSRKINRKIKDQSSELALGIATVKLASSKWKKQQIQKRQLIQKKRVKFGRG